MSVRVHLALLDRKLNGPRRARMIIAQLLALGFRI